MRKITDAQTAEYNDFAAQAERGHFMQTTYWRDLKVNFGWQNLGQYVLERDARITAAFSVLQRTKLGVKILYVPRGPLWSGQDAELTAEVLNALKNLAREQHAFFIRISPKFAEQDAPIKQALNAHGFYFSKKQLQTKATMLIDLTRPEEELIGSFHEKTRYNIRLAARKGVTVSPLNSETELKEFYRVLEQMAARQEYDLQTYEYYKYIWQKLPIARIYLAKFENKVIGGAAIFVFRDTAYYMYGAFDSECRQLMGNYLLHWEIMRLAKAQGLCYYDLQGVPLDKSAEHPMYGFYRFKKGFNGQETEFIGEYDYTPYPWLYRLWNNFTLHKKQYLQ